MDENVFSKVTELVINKLEGGYYNPAWHKTGDSRYGTSGETMFGIDRKNGGSLNTSPAGLKFWSIIDANKTPDVWKWNYMGGALAGELKGLVAKMMLPAYESFSKSSMSPQLKAIVDNDPRLLFHFIYAAWNGPGWFAKFAKDLDTAYASGVKDSSGLVQAAINSRVTEGYEKGSPPNSLMEQGGRKIASFINDIPGLFTQGVEAGAQAITDTAQKSADKIKNNPKTVIALLAIIIAGSALLLTLLNKKKHGIKLQ